MADNPAEYLRPETRSGRVSFATKLAHGVGSMPGNYKDFVFSTFLLLYYSQILGLSASWVSLVLAITLIIDAVTDPLMGAISDNFKPRRFPNLGRRHLFMYMAILPLGLSLYCLFFTTKLGKPAGVVGMAVFLGRCCATSVYALRCAMGSAVCRTH